MIASRFAFLLPVVLLAAVGCFGGGEQTPAASTPVPPVEGTVCNTLDPCVKPTTESTRSASTPRPRPPEPCPIAAEICALADTFLPAIRGSEPEHIVERSRTQQLPCPEGRETTAELWMVEPCKGRTPGSSVAVYELHTGKGPSFFTNREDYLAAVIRGRSSSGADAVTLAVGCAVVETGGPGTADCTRGSVAVYRATSTSSEVALVFSRPSDADQWMIEKLWNIFPSTVPDSIPDGLRLEINTLAGVTAVELYPYSSE